MSQMSKEWVWIVLFVWGMSGRHKLKADEGLMMMQELEDRLKEHTDKLEHIRLSAVDLRDALSEVCFSLLITAVVCLWMSSVSCASSDPHRITTIWNSASLSTWTGSDSWPIAWRLYRWTRPCLCRCSSCFYLTPDTEHKLYCRTCKPSTAASQQKCVEYSAEIIFLFIFVLYFTVQISKTFLHQDTFIWQAKLHYINCFLTFLLLLLFFKLHIC